ncbi:Triphosphoribosyl-dephospho-CoA synthetase [Lachnospiraceae bacterium JC7]|nr:Triphosphoribosyl-dephospho-CoA synthetase [Lachnospiraceae bacterium JC7]
MQDRRGVEFHSIEELVETVGWNVRNALLGEVYATPKPGLVDRRDTGSHKDMSYETFLASTEAITPYLVDMFEAGLRSGAEYEKTAQDNLSSDSLTDEERLFLGIRNIGIGAEKAMYAATDNVNTHKGMIFTMGILLAAAGMIAGNRLKKQHDDRAGNLSDIRSNSEKSVAKLETQYVFFDINEILETGRRMSARILEKDFIEMEKREPKSHGEKLYHNYGEKGIRGQAMEGFPVIKEMGVVSMRKYLSIAEDEALRSEICRRATLRKDLLDAEGNMRDEHFENAVNISTLLAIMSELNDTNVLTRSSYGEMEWLKAESAKIVEIGAAFSEEGLSAIEELNVKCIEKNISPGGAADILAVTILLLKLEGIGYV